MKVGEYKQINDIIYLVEELDFLRRYVLSDTGHTTSRFVAKVESLTEQLESLNELIDQLEEALIPEIITITVTGGEEDYEFSYDVADGPDADGYDITVYLKERYTQTFSSSKDPNALWDVTDYRIGDNPANWHLGDVDTSTAAHGGPAPHYFEWIRDGITTRINVTIIDR